MSVLIVMVPTALLLGFGFVAAFVWCAYRGQYDDLDTPAYRLLLEEKNESTRGQ